MREIKCRGKRIDNGKWVEGYYCKHIKRQLCPMGDKLKEDDVEHIIFFDGFADWNMPQELRGAYVLPETVGQYTGMKDKNGTKIYEGDIIRQDNNVVGVIRFGKYTQPFNDNADTKHIGFYVDWTDMFRRDLGHWAEKCTVIGNIHDNPELMEEVQV